MRVQIVKTIHDSVWYSNHILDTFEVYENTSRKSLYFLTKAEQEKLALKNCAIRKEDCEIIEY
jgi:hypothetical protein